MTDTTSLRHVAREAGCSPATITHLVRRGILGPRRPETRATVPYIPTEHADRLIAIIKAGLATRPMAELMSKDPVQVLVAAERLQELAIAAMEQQDKGRSEPAA